MRTAALHCYGTDELSCATGSSFADITSLFAGWSSLA